MSIKIEFCGIPGAGKSTLCKHVFRLLAENDVEFLGRDVLRERSLKQRDFGIAGNLMGSLIPGWRRDFLGLPHGLNDWHRFAVRYPDFVSIIHSWLTDKRADDVWRSCVYYAVLTSAFDFELAEEFKRPVLFDEGWAQRFFTLRGYRGLGASGDSVVYALQMPRPSAVIVVQSSSELCLSRLRERTSFPLLLQGYPNEQLSARLRQGAIRIGELADALDSNQVPVLRVSGEGDPTSEAKMIAEFILTRIGKD